MRKKKLAPATIANYSRKEKWEHKSTFESFLLMGPARTIKELSELTGYSQSTLSKWNHRFKWNDRVALRDQKVLQKVEDDNDNIYMEKVKARHQKAYQDVQEKALKQIAKKRVSFDNDKDAAIALDIGVKGERDVLGLRDTKLKAALAKEGFAALVELVSGS